MPRFLILPRDEPSEFLSLSPDEMQAVIMRYGAWAADHMAAGRLETGEKLTDSAGKVLRGVGDDLSVTDGPFAEVKEVVGGFWIANCADYDEAVGIMRDCPHLEFGSIEIRQIEVMEQV